MYPMGKVLSYLNQNKRLLVSSMLLSLIFANCTETPTGEFGWAPRDERDMEEMEIEGSIPVEYRIERENLIFDDRDTIWWIYRLKRIPMNPEFLAALYIDTLAPEPVQLYLRTATPVRRESGYIIRQYFEPLQPGRYRLVIGFESEVIDEVQFHVHPSSGWDFPSEAEEPDDILRFSRIRDQQ